VLPRMIWVPISRSSRGSSAFTLAWRADGHEDRRIHDAMRGGEPASRALVCESVLSSSNIVAEVLTQSRKAAKPQRKKFQHVPQCHVTGPCFTT